MRYPDFQSHSALLTIFSERDNNMKSTYLLSALVPGFASVQAATYTGGNINVPAGTSAVCDNTNLIFTGSQVYVGEGASLSTNYIMLQNNGQSITNHGHFSATSISIGDNNSNSCMTNYGILSDADTSLYDGEYGLLHIKGNNGQVTNYGSIQGVSTITGGILYAMDDSVYGDIDVYSSGTLYVNGNITINGDLYLNQEESVIVFSEGSCVDLNGGILSLSGNIVLTVDYEVNDSMTITKDTFFVNYDNEWSDFNDETVITIKGLNSETTRTVAQLSAVPEPTTTLSLLALVGLVYRRRR